MTIIGISLGWNCISKDYGIKMGICKNKRDGYMTCPFDYAVSNYKGIVDCINDDFRFLTDPNFLSIIQPKFCSGGISTNDLLIYHTKYRFIFNHESPRHANLAQTQCWQNGENHFIQNDFEEFKKRYDKRIENFRNYMTSGKNVIFILRKYGNNNDELLDALKKHYPTANYAINNISIEGEFIPYKEDHLQMGFSEDEIFVQ